MWRLNEIFEQQNVDVNENVHFSLVSCHREIPYGVKEKVWVDAMDE